jgi:NLR family CARD domain-containing protein 3
MVSQLDLSDQQLCGLNEDGDGTYTAEGITAIADALRVNGGLTVANLLGNQLDAESAKMLAEVAKQKGISLCGIQRGQTTADFSRKDLNPPDAILLASDLSQAVVTGGLTSLDLSNQLLCGVTQTGLGTYTAEGITAIAEAMRVNGALTSLDLSNNSLGGVNAYGGTYTAEGITVIADALRVNGGLTALDLSFNELKDEGVSAVCEAIQSNKETKLASLNMAMTRIGPVGAKSVAAMVAVTGGLTSIDLSGNQLCGIWSDICGQHGGGRAARAARRAGRT